MAASAYERNRGAAGHWRDEVTQRKHCETRHEYNDSDRIFCDMGSDPSGDCRWDRSFRHSARPLTKGRARRRFYPKTAFRSAPAFKAKMICFGDGGLSTLK